MFARAMLPGGSVPPDGRRFGREAGIGAVALALVVALGAVSCQPSPRLPDPLPFPADYLPGLSYTNFEDSAVPVSIHIVRVDRQQPDLTLRILHSRPRIQEVTNMSEMLGALGEESGQPVAAINGDYFDREQPYAGDPRGVEILDGEVTSAPGGYISLWLDAAGQPQATNVAPLFKATWPDGTTTPFGLNERRRTNSMVLYTSRFGRSTGTRSNGFELVLERPEGGPWPPLRLGQVYTGQVAQVTTTNTPLSSNRLVLSIGPLLVANLPSLQTGAVVWLSTRTRPDLAKAPLAIGGGPILVRQGRAQKIRTPTKEEAPTQWAPRVAFERHPRTAFGWNDRYFYLVEVDGRQVLARLSEGMTLAELARCMVNLGCREAVNLDGGGSATFWLDGCTVSSPCDKREREIANAVVIFRKPPPPTWTAATNAPAMN